MIMRNNYRKQVRRGFTLMEILVVVAIILVLASLGGYYIIGAANDARKSTAKGQIRTIEQAVEAYNLKHHGEYPPNLQVLIQKDAFGGPYLKNGDYLLDPWGKQFQYTPNGADGQPRISCQPPDGSPEIHNGQSKGISEP